MRYFIPHIVKARFSSITEMGFSIFLQSNVTIKILVFTLKLKDRKTENYKTASGHHKVEEYTAKQYSPTGKSQNRKRSSQGRGCKSNPEYGKCKFFVVTKPQAVITRSSYVDANLFNKLLMARVTKPQAVITRSSKLLKKL